MKSMRGICWSFCPLIFLFDNVRLQDGIWRLDYRPNPDISPKRDRRPGAARHERLAYHRRASVAAFCISKASCRRMSLSALACWRTSMPVATSAATAKLVDGPLAHGACRPRTSAGRRHSSRASVAAADLTRSEFHYLDRNITVSGSCRPAFTTPRGIPKSLKSA